MNDIFTKITWGIIPLRLVPNYITGLRSRHVCVWTTCRKLLPKALCHWVETEMVSIVCCCSGLSRVTNQCRGQYYGPASSWPSKRQRQVGVVLLNKAYRILQYEGERQIRLRDVAWKFLSLGSLVILSHKCCCKNVFTPVRCMWNSSLRSFCISVRDAMWICCWLSNLFNYLLSNILYSFFYPCNNSY